MFDIIFFCDGGVVGKEVIRVVFSEVGGLEKG